MGLGSYPAGTGLAGLDVPLPPSTLTTLPDQGAPVFFIQTRGFKELPDGTFVTADDVDQAVDLALGIAAQTIASTPEVGNTLLSIPRLSTATRDAAVKDRVKQALAGLIDAGLVIVSSLSIQEASRGARFVFVSYWNTRRQGKAPTPIKVAI